MHPHSLDPYGYGTYAGYPYALSGYEYVGAPPPPPKSPNADLFGRLAAVGLVVAGVAGCYLVLTKMGKNERRARRQSTKAMIGALGKRAERGAEHAVREAGHKLGEFFEARALPPAPKRMSFEVIDKGR
jgi:hypothetical protein